MFLGLIRQRVEWRAAIAADARHLIESFNELAYFEARERVRPLHRWRARSPLLDCRQARNRPAAGLTIGLAGADAWS